MNHTCGTTFGTASRKRINYRIITDLILEDIRCMPSLTHVQLLALLKKNSRIDISYCVAWSGRSAVFGDHTTSFSMLPFYLAE